MQTVLIILTMAALLLDRPCIPKERVCCVIGMCAVLEDTMQWFPEVIVAVTTIALVLSVFFILAFLVHMGVKNCGFD